MRGAYVVMACCTRPGSRPVAVCPWLLKQRLPTPCHTICFSASQSVDYKEAHRSLVWSGVGSNWTDWKGEWSTVFRIPVEQLYR